MDFNGTEFESILSFSRDSEGKRTGSWISVWGVSELKDVKYEEGQLSFQHVFQNRDGETNTSTFKGTIKEGKLTGTLKSERGELPLKGERAKRIPRAVGGWEMKFTMGEREITTSFNVKVGKDDKLEIDWPSERVEHKISDVKYERGRLSFKTKSKMDENEWESTFEGRIQGDTLSGAFKSERGELKAEAKRIGAPIIGTWNLEITAEWGALKQRLRVNGDMTALYGTLPIKKVQFKDGKVAFKIVMEFGERKFEMDFTGEIKESKLVGELKSSQGASKITGTKVIRPRRRPAQPGKIQEQG